MKYAIVIAILSIAAVAYGQAVQSVDVPMGTSGVLYRSSINSKDSVNAKTGEPSCGAFYASSSNVQILVTTADSSVVAVIRPWVAMTVSGSTTEYGKGDTTSITGSTTLTLYGLAGSTKIEVVSVSGGVSTASDSISAIYIKQ